MPEIGRIYILSLSGNSTSTQAENPDGGSGSGTTSTSSSTSSSNNRKSHSCLFDLDYSNAYREEEYHLFNQAISNFNQSTKSTEPVIILSPNSLTEAVLMFTHSRADDIMLVTLARLHRKPSSIEKVEALQLNSRLMKMLQNYIGKMTVSNVLANITLLAEVIDAMLISGWLHLLETDKVRGFLSHTYQEPTSYVTRKSADPVASVLSLALSSSQSISSSHGYKPSANDTVVKSVHGEKKEELFLDMIEDITINGLAADSSNLCVISGTLKARNTGSSSLQLHIQLKNPQSNMSAQMSTTTPGTKANDVTASSPASLSAEVGIGSSDLMSYTINTENSPFKVTSNSERVSVKSKLASHSLTVSEDKKSLVWDIPEIAGQTSGTISFKILHDQQQKSDFPAKKLQVRLEFEISNYLCSGNKIQSVKIPSRASHTTPVKKWIRHLSVSRQCVLCVTDDCSA